MAMKDEKELCVRCAQPTPYVIKVPVTVRRYYVEGSGQLCEACWGQLYIDDNIGKPNVEESD